MIIYPLFFSCNNQPFGLKKKHYSIRVKLRLITFHIFLRLLFQGFLFKYDDSPSLAHKGLEVALYLFCNILL